MRGTFRRYAIYHLPDEPELAAFGAQWLGHDVATGGSATHLAKGAGAALVQTPRKYGFHGTLKPPFGLAGGHGPDDLIAAVSDLAARLKAVEVEGLRLARLGRFFALVPVGDAQGIAALAEAYVTQLDRFRALPSDAELKKRRAKGLTARQEALLQAWGYPYVLDEFRFHLTLTGALSEEEARLAETLLSQYLPEMPRPFRLGSISLLGEQGDGRFVQIQRFSL